MLVNVPLTICSEIIDFLWINHKKQFDCKTDGIIKFINKTPAYVKKAITFLAEVKIISERNSKIALTDASIENLKHDSKAGALLIKAMSEHEAFKEYNSLLSNGKSGKISARTVKTLYNINSTEDDIISSFKNRAKFIEEKAVTHTKSESILTQKSKSPIDERANLSLMKEKKESIDKIGHNDVIGVITASPDEFNAVKNLLTGTGLQQVDDSDSVSYYLGTLEGNGKKFKIILPYPLDMGVASAVVSTTKVIANFRPKYLFMVGIAARNKKVNNIGDILIAEKSLDYNEVVEGEKKDKLMQAPDSINKHLKTQLSQFRDSDFVKLIEDGYTEKEKIKTPLKCSLGLLVTGSSLMRSQVRVEEINETYVNVIGLDMETRGFYFASAHTLKQGQPYFVSMKSVSDFGDNSDHGLSALERRKYALYTSSNAFRTFVLNYIPN
jgi:nucleoside phosphorylase